MAKVRSQFQKLFGKRAVKTLLWSFLLYCAITLVFHFFSFMHAHPTEFGIERFRELTIALWANVIFAGTFGLLAAVMSLFRPEEDSVDKRLGYLYPRSSTLSGDARSRLGKNAMKLAGPGISGKLHFVVERFDREKNAFWLSVSITYTLRNILQDEVYEDEIEIFVAPDVVPNVHEVGRLIESAITCGEADPPRVVNDFQIPILATEPRYQRVFGIRIPPGAEAIHTYSFNAWSVQGEAWLSSNQRYAENVEVCITNRTASQITCKLSRGTNNPTVNPEHIVTRQIPSLDEVTLKQGLVLDGNRDNIQLVFTL
jgi:hypothetical protein